MVFKQKTIEKINKFIVENFHPYIIYLFGSAVKDTFREESDVDIAFLSTDAFSEYEVFIKAQELADILKRDVDLIDLEKASTVFKAQIVGTGEKIYCNDETRRMYFEMYAFKDYALLNEERAVILEQIKQRGYVYGK